MNPKKLARKTPKKKNDEQINWFLKQGYPPEIIDEFMAEQDQYEDGYYDENGEETGYYDENGEWIDYPPEQLTQPPLEDQIVPEDGELMEEDVEEAVPSPPPPTAQALQPAKPAQTSKAGATNDAIDKDLKAAQDAAKAAGDVAKNLIGGIGGSLFGGGKKSGGFGLGGLMGSPKPAPKTASPPKPAAQPPPAKAKTPPQAQKPTTPPKTQPEPSQQPMEQDGEELVREDEEDFDIDAAFGGPAAPGSVPGTAAGSRKPSAGDPADLGPAERRQSQLEQLEEEQKEPILESEVEKIVDEVKEDQAGDPNNKETPTGGRQVAFAEDGRPKFVKHINKTRTMSGRQKWDWAFEKIIQVRGSDLHATPRRRRQKREKTNQNGEETAALLSIEHPQST